MPVFEEVFTVAAPIRTVWEFLLDADRVAPCMPGCEKVERIDADNFFVTVKARVGIIAADVKMRVTMTEKRPPSHLSSVAEGKETNLGSAVKMKNTLDLREVSPDETEVRYRSEVSVLGRLGTLGFSVMKGKVKQQGEAFANNVKARLEPGAL